MGKKAILAALPSYARGLITWTLGLSAWNLMILWAKCNKLLRRQYWINYCQGAISLQVATRSLKFRQINPKLRLLMECWMMSGNFICERFGKSKYMSMLKIFRATCFYTKIKSLCPGRFNRYKRFLDCDAAWGLKLCMILSSGS